MPETTAIRSSTTPQFREPVTRAVTSLDLGALAVVLLWIAAIVCASLEATMGFDRSLTGLSYTTAATATMLWFLAWHLRRRRRADIDDRRQIVAAEEARHREVMEALATLAKEAEHLSARFDQTPGPLGTASPEEVQAVLPQGMAAQIWEMGRRSALRDSAGAAN